jgi:hypothetical protein
MGGAGRGLALLCLLYPLSAAAQDGLTGRTIVFNVLTFDDPLSPLFTGPDYIAKVTQGPEFGMIRQGTDGLDVVPVLIDLSDSRIDLSYAQNDPGQFAHAKFNGYVLRFPTDCVLIGGAAIDPKTTTLPLTDANLILTPQSLSLNVAGLPFDQTSRIGIIVEVMDCPVS